MRTLYVSYTPNLTLEIMQNVCPTAKFYSNGVLNAYKLVETDAGVTIIPSINDKVIITIWELKSKDKENLDRVMGYRLRFKKVIKVEFNKEQVEIILYYTQRTLL